VLRHSPLFLGDGDFLRRPQKVTVPFLRSLAEGGHSNTMKSSQQAKYYVRKIMENRKVSL
jgi:hypothetical protein